MYINESFVLEKNDLYINFDKFESGKSNICLITGLSGSGKSTLGKELSKKYKAEYVELDKIFLFKSIDELKYLSKTFDDFFKENMSLISIMHTKSDSSGIPLKILNALIEYCKKIKNKKFVIEGVQIYLFADKSIKNYPIIIKNTPALKSMFRMFKRDFIDFDGLKYHQCIKYIPKFLKIYIQDEKDFNVFKKKILKEGGGLNMYVNESFVLEKNDLYINFDKFESGESNICLITGLSGSGKSTLGSEISNKYNAIHVEIDLFFPMDEEDSLDILPKVFSGYIKKHKKFYQKIADNDFRYNRKLSIDILHYIIDYRKSIKNMKFVIEGIQIYMFGDESIVEYPIVIKNTSALQSLIRMIKRDKNAMMEPDRDDINAKNSYINLIKRIPKFLRYYIDDEKNLNDFRKKIVKEDGNVNLLETDLNSIVIFSTDILPEYICEEYLNTKIDNDKFNTVNAVERYLVIELSQLIKQSKLDKMRVNDIIDNRFKELMYNRNEEKERNLMFEIKQIKQVDLSYDVLEAILKNSIFNPNNILYLKTILNSNGDSSNEEYLEISLATKSFLKSMELIKYLAMKLDTSDERFLIIYNKIQAILYEFKDFYSDSSDFNLGTCNGIIKDELAPNIDDISSDDIIYIFDELKTFLINQVDYRLYYMINEFKCLSYRMEIRQQENNRGATLESFDLEKKYNDSLVKFENMDITDEDGELDIIKLAEAYQLAHDICKYQYMQEADTKIITRGTNKITKAIGNASAKSRGMADAKSKVGAIKRGARIVDDRASDAINKKIDDIMNFSRDAKREKILTGKNTVRVSSVLKNAIKILVAGTAGVGLFGPIAGAVIGLIGVLGARGVSKNVEDREKKRILLELETELKIVKEKVEDAKGENNKRQKYQLMRIQANLEKEITRIKHGLRYY